MVWSNNSSQQKQVHLLLEQLFEAGLLTRDQIEVIRIDHAATAIPIPEVLCQRGWIKEQTISYFMQNIVNTESKSSQTEHLKQQVEQLHQQQVKLSKVKIALEKEIEKLRKEKGVPQQYGPKQHQNQLTLDRNKTQLSSARHHDVNNDSRSKRDTQDSIAWIG